MFPFLLLPNELRVQIVDCLDVSTRLKCLKVNKILRENLGVIGLLPSQLESIAIDCKLYGKLIIRLIDTNFSSIQLHRSAIYEAFEDSPQFEVKFDGDKDIYCFPINLAEIILEKWENRARAKTLTISAEEAFVETVDNIGIRRTTYLAYADNLEIHFKFLPVLEKCANSLSSIPKNIEIIWTSYLEDFDQNDDLQKLVTFFQILKSNHEFNLLLKSKNNKTLFEHNKLNK